MKKWVQLSISSITITRLSGYGIAVRTISQGIDNFFRKLWEQSWVNHCQSIIRNWVEAFYQSSKSAFGEGLGRYCRKPLEVAIILLIALMPVLNAWGTLLSLMLLLLVIRLPDHKPPDAGLFVFWLALFTGVLMVLGPRGLGRLAPVTVWLLIAGLSGWTFSAGFSRKVIGYMLLASMFWMIIGLWQQWAGVPTPSGWLEQGQSLLISTRSYSVFGNPNLYGLYLLSVLIFAFSGINDGNRLYRVFSWFILFLGSVSLVFTYSRTTWLLGLVAVVGWFGGRIFSGRRLYFWLGVLFLFGWSGFRIRMLGPANFFESTLWVRVQIWQKTFRILTDFWLWGSGPGSFMEVYGKYPTGNVLVQHGHQLYLQMWLESGILSLAAFIRVAAKNFSGFTGLQGNTKALALVIVIFLMYGFFETWSVHPYTGGYFWLLIGLWQSLRTGQIDL